MKLVVSNIAWTNEEEPAVAKLLQELGVRYVEIAPTKKWNDPTVEATDSAINQYKDFWKGFDIEIVAFQSMLFNRPDLKLFAGDDLRAEALDYLIKFIKLAPRFGAGIMVFGSPKNRQKGELSDQEALAIAGKFFSELGEVAEANSIRFCIEPNPPEYACDFITSARQGIELVRAINSPGFGLHLDIAGMTLAGNDIGESIMQAGSLLKHFHISAPYLEPVEDRNDVAYRQSAKALKQIGYEHFVSIEMKPQTVGDNLERVKKAVQFAQSVYSS